MKSTETGSKFVDAWGWEWEAWGVTANWDDQNVLKSNYSDSSTTF